MSGRFSADLFTSIGISWVSLLPASVVLWDNWVSALIENNANPVKRHNIAGMESALSVFVLCPEWGKNSRFSFSITRSSILGSTPVMPGRTVIRIVSAIY